MRDSDIIININSDSKKVKVEKKSDSKTDAKLTGENKVQLILPIDRKTLKTDAKGGLSFHGKLTEPRMSLNGWLYLPQELAPQDGKTVPLTIMHEEQFTDDIPNRGTMKLSFDEKTWDLNYKAYTVDKEAIDGIESGKYTAVSMSAEWEEFDMIRGWMFPKDVKTTHGSLVKDPGITSATVKTDAYVQCCDGMYPLQKCDSKIVQEIKDFTSNKQVKQKTDMKKSKKDMEEESQVVEVLAEQIVEMEEDKDEIKEQLAMELEIHENVVESILAGDQEMTDEFLEAFSKLKGADAEALKPFFSDQYEASDMEEEEEEKKEDMEEEKKKKDKKKDKKSDSKTSVKVDGKTSEITVKVDASEVTEAFDGMKSTIKDLGEVIVSKNKPRGKADGKSVLTKKQQKAKFYDAITQSLHKFQSLRMDWVQEQLKKDGLSMDAIQNGTTSNVSTAAGAQWLEDITVIPRGLKTSLRATCEVVQIEHGAKEVHFTLISTPSPSDGDAPTVPADVTHIITDLTATPKERILKQRVTDQAARNTSVNLGEAVATTFRDSEVLDEDSVVLTELNGLTETDLAGSFAPNDHTTDTDVVAADVFDNSLLRKARAALVNQGWEAAKMPGMAVCVMSPEQMEQLMGDEKIQRYIEWVADGNVLKTGYIPRLHGIDLLESSQVPTVDGATGVTAHRAYVYLRETAVGLGFTKDLEIETARYPEERATTIIASYELAAKCKTEKAVVRLTTYGEPRS